MLSPDAQAAWSAVIDAYVAEGHDPTVLRMASEGHPNARAYIVEQIAETEDVSCPCGADELCPGVTLPDRTAYRDALRALLVVLDREAAPA